jgi:hypothetical protein
MRVYYLHQNYLDDFQIILLLLLLFNRIYLSILTRGCGLEYGKIKKYGSWRSRIIHIGVINYHLTDITFFLHFCTIPPFLFYINTDCRITLRFSIIPPSIYRLNYVFVCRHERKKLRKNTINSIVIISTGCLLNALEFIRNMLSIHWSFSTYDNI